MKDLKEDKMGKYFKEENLVDLREVLDNRDYRRAVIEKCSKENPATSVLSFKLNIPGPQKINKKLIELFDKGYDEILNNIKEHGWTYRLADKWEKNTGKEAILVVDADGYDLKKTMVDLEESSKLARLYDIDIVYKNKDITREDLGKDGRKCIICGKKVASCARSRRHSVGEMQEYIEKILDTI